MSDETRDAPHPEAKRTDEEADKKPYRYPLKRVHWRFPDPDYTGDMFQPQVAPAQGQAGYRLRDFRVEFRNLQEV